MFTHIVQHPCLTFAKKAPAYPPLVAGRLLILTRLVWSNLLSPPLLALLSNMKLERKKLQGTNTLAYFDRLSILNIKQKMKKDTRDNNSNLFCRTFNLKY